MALVTDTDVEKGLLPIIVEIKKITNYKSVWSENCAKELKDSKNIEDKKAKKQEEKNSGGGKSQSAAMWSNIYNSLTVWIKLRSMCSDEELKELQHSDFKLTNKHLEQLNLMAQVEHYRWNMEQLLLRFKPLTEEQQNKFKLYINNGWKADFDYYKKKLKIEGKHLDLCSYDNLNYVDPDPMIYDKCFIAMAPILAKELKDKC